MSPKRGLCHLNVNNEYFGSFEEEQRYDDDNNSQTAPVSADLFLVPCKQIYNDCLKENMLQLNMQTLTCVVCVFWEYVTSVCGCQGDFFQNEIFICLLKKDDICYLFAIYPG